MYLPLLFFVVGSLASQDACPLGDLPMENPDLFEGDMLGFESPEDRNAIADKELRWPGGIIFYKIDESLSSHKKTLTNVVMKEFEKKTCLKFIERTTQPDYITIFKGKGCYSHVGRVGGEQLLSLGDGCYRPGNMYHEFTHSLGFIHEQNRSDRDDYINIHWDNIKEGMEKQFTKFGSKENILYNKFDYDSVMLYGEFTFSKDRTKMKTMTAKKKGTTLKEVFEKLPTKSDFYRINEMYECS